LKKDAKTCLAVAGSPETAGLLQCLVANNQMLHVRIGKLDTARAERESW
jgi:hypothetical protein